MIVLRCAWKNMSPHISPPPPPLSLPPPHQEIKKTINASAAEITRESKNTVMGREYTQACFDI